MRAQQVINTILTQYDGEKNLLKKAGIKKDHPAILAIRSLIIQHDDWTHFFEIFMCFHRNKPYDNDAAALAVYHLMMGLVRHCSMLVSVQGEARHYDVDYRQNFHADDLDILSLDADRSKAKFFDKVAIGLIKKFSNNASIHREKKVSGVLSDIFEKLADNALLTGANFKLLYRVHFRIQAERIASRVLNEINPVLNNPENIDILNECSNLWFLLGSRVVRNEISETFREEMLQAAEIYGMVQTYYAFGSETFDRIPVHLFTQDLFDRMIASGEAGSLAQIPRELIRGTIVATFLLIPRFTPNNVANPLNFWDDLARRRMLAAQNAPAPAPVPVLVPNALVPAPAPAPVPVLVPAPIRRAAAVVGPNRRMDNNTHTASVHKTVSESAVRLHTRYGEKINTTEKLAAVTAEVKKYINDLPHDPTNPDDLKKIEAILAENNASKAALIQEYGSVDQVEDAKKYILDLPDNLEKMTPFLEKIEAAKRAINAMVDTTRFDSIDQSSNVSTKQLIALTFLAINDSDLRVGRLEDAKNRFVNGLYEIQRGYNLSETGKDLGGNDLPICVVGTFNKLIEMIAGFHPDCEIKFITIATATLKLQAVAKEEARAYLLNSSKHKNPEECTALKSIIEIEEAGNIEPIWTHIQARIADQIFDEFKILFPAKNAEFLGFIEIGMLTSLPGEVLNNLKKIANPLLALIDQIDQLPDICEEVFDLKKLALHISTRNTMRDNHKYKTLSEDYHEKMPAICSAAEAKKRLEITSEHDIALQRIAGNKNALFGSPAPAPAACTAAAENNRLN